MGKPKALKVMEDKVLAEVIVSVIYRIMSLTLKEIGGGIGYPKIPSQSKGTSPGLGGRVLSESKILSCSEGAESEMLMTWYRMYRNRIRKERSTENCIGATTSSTIG
jgi:hypothetical protein